MFSYLKPFDTIQTKMQAQKGFEGSNLVKTLVKIMKTDGIKGFYRYYILLKIYLN